ncbi:MAG TPA: Crp/Fnr family transcriptional regulator [Acidobacteriaceae bacterium]|nr:Crp/Fnr family transcriptional regulator [Acidobacteriaceae bacterium]
MNFRNVILQHLDADAIERLRLRSVPLELAQTLEDPGSRIDNIFFLEEGIGSMTTMFEDGSQVEAGMFGWESAIGAPSLMGIRKSRNHIAVQVPGHAWVASKEVAEQEFRRLDCFHDLVLRYMQSQILQATQSCGCNARHNVQQRLSRWLLLCRDRTSADVLQLTQDFLAAMLGVERPAVTVVAGKLQELGLIEYSRGRVRITDRDGLEALACECYQVARSELQAFREYADGRAELYHSKDRGLRRA